MLTNSRNTIVRLGVLAFVVALALTAAYYYGVARAQSVVALPTSISLSGQAAAAATLPTATTVPAAAQSASPPTTPSTTKVATVGRSTSQSGTGQPSTTATTSRASRPAQSASSPTTREVVTPIRGWDCEPDHGSAPSGGSGTGNGDCR
jgi:hypothetical protein